MTALTVLLVEDDLLQPRLMHDLLAAAAAPSFAVEHVTRLGAALNRARLGGIDVILLDLSLPDEQGLTGVKRLRAAVPHVPIVVMSGNADELLAIKGVREGAQNYLVKGTVDGDLLARTLHYAIERQRVEDDLAYLAYHDSLTRLPNRALFADRLAHTLAQAGRYGQRVALLFLDLDGFKQVNDVLGHEAGDELLREVGRRLARCTRESDTVARLSGDEFTVILPDIGAREAAAVVARKIIEAIGARIPVKGSGREAMVTANIGVSVYPDDSHAAAALIRAADDAMYRSKREGKNTYTFASEPEPEFDSEPEDAGNVVALPIRRRE